jgi:hypothetical protein
MFVGAFIKVLHGGRIVKKLKSYILQEAGPVMKFLVSCRMLLRGKGKESAPPPIPCMFPGYPSNTSLAIQMKHTCHCILYSSLSHDRLIKFISTTVSTFREFWVLWVSGVWASVRQGSSGSKSEAGTTAASLTFLPALNPHSGSDEIQENQQLTVGQGFRNR